MGFKKDHPKFGGIKKGGEHLVAKTHKEILTDIINNEFQFVPDALQAVRIKDKFKYLVLLEKFLPYIMPKQSVVGVGIDDSIKQRINELFPFEPPEDAGI